MLNNQSSRSHAVFEFHFSFVDWDKPKELQESLLWIVDLAGSEKCILNPSLWKEEKEKYLSELTQINTSLSTLGQCISALANSKK